MILPISLRPKVELLEAVVAEWPVRVALDHIVQWLLQFDPDDYDVGVRVIKNLNVFGPDEIRTGLQVAYARLLRRARDRSTRIELGNTIFAAIGDSGKSGAMMAYEFRVANELPESNFSTEDRADYLERGIVENVVLVDDVLGTGKSAIDAASKVREEATPLGVKNLFVLAVCGFDEAVEKVAKETGADTFAAFTFGTDDTVSSYDAPFFHGLEHREKERLLERLKYYNGRCHRSELGFGNVGALLAFRHNSPNVTIPIVWANGNGWSPLFPRLGRISGIDHFYAQARKAQESRKAQQVKNAPSRRADEQSSPRGVTLLVEGKTDEMVLDFVCAKWDLAKRLGVENISTVSLGGIYSSMRLFELIKATGGHFVLVLDDDAATQRWRAKEGANTGIPIVVLHPSVIGLMHFDALREMMGISEDIVALTATGDLEHQIFRDIEMRLRRQGFGRTPSITQAMLEKFLDETAVTRLVDELSAAVASSFGKPPGSPGVTQGDPTQTVK